MIESRYWKEELHRISKTLKPIGKPKPWSERGVCIIERDLMIGFFVLRKLMEHFKVSKKVSSRKVKVIRYPRTASNISVLNHWNIDKHYNFDGGFEAEKDVIYLANQFIHSSVSYVIRDDTRNWSTVVLVSDYDRNKFIWEISIKAIQELFLLASKDYPTSIRMVFNKEKGDYDVSLN